MNKFKVAIIALAGLFATTMISCERVAPNYQGVLMENFGKSGKSDFTLQKGRVWTMTPGTELFQVPLFDQRAGFEQELKLKAADNTPFSAQPTYSYKVISDRAVDIVFDNKQVGSGDDFMKSVEDNILEPRVYDLIKEESRKYDTDSLMSTGGSLRFEKALEIIVEEEFKKRGLQLISFSAQIDFSKGVKDKIEARNEVNTNISVIDQQIEEQRKRNQLAELQVQENLIKSKGITPEILQQQAINKWDGSLPTTWSGSGLPFVKAIK